MQTSPEPTFWLNGALCSTEDAGISPSDAGFTTGDGVFETLLVENGKPFALTRHLNRLDAACGRVGLPAPDQDALRVGCAEMVEATVSPATPARLRITVTGGTERPTTTITTGPAPNHSPNAAVHLLTYTRNERSVLAGVKSTSYGENVVALRFAKSLGGDEAIFGNTAGNLSEGSCTNVFVVDGVRVLTPPLSSGCLPGVTRELVLELCREFEIEVEETDLPMAEFARVGEGFLTSSLRHLQPIRSIDGLSIDVEENAITRWLIDLYRVLRERDSDP